jgi:hypothetical protein
MPLSPYLAQLLSAYEPERLLALLNWLEPDLSVVDEESPFQEKETSPMSATTIENSDPESVTGSAVSLDDLVIFSILDEFGPQFMGKPYFHWLSRCVCERFAEQHTPV